MRVTLYSRPGCALCDEVRDELKSLRLQVPHELIDVNIETDAALHARYVEQVPVVEIGPYTLRAPISATDLRVALQAYASAAKSTADAGATNPSAVRTNRMLRFLSRHWLALFNLLILLYVGLPFLAPVLMKAGAERQANWIYKAYSPLCHQLAFRSWFLFGPQFAYPRALAGTSLTSFGAATGIDENDWTAAREFVGNEAVGYKVALCERDVAIYAGLLLGGLIFAGFRRLMPLPLWAWFLFGIVPVALDGGSQLLGAFPFLGWMARESTPLLRTVTGLAFGLANAWMAYPYVEESMKEVRVLSSARLAGTRSG
jgi:uncharacterized membrane protein/glutaredoxin